MKQLAVILRYYYRYSWASVLLACLGLGSLFFQLILLLVTLSTGFPLLHEVVFAWSMVTLFFLLGAPYTSFLVSARILLASRQLALLPGFQILTGLSLLLPALIISFMPALLAPVLLPDSPSFLHVFAFVFGLVSIYTAIMQPALAGRVDWNLFNACIAIFALFLIHSGHAILQLLFRPEISACLLIFAALFWCYTFHRLKTKRVFRLNPSVSDSWEEQSNFKRMEIGGKIATPAGTLALGYPDSLWSRLLRLFFGLFLFPLLVMIYQLVVSGGDTSTPFLAVRVYLMIYVMFAMLNSTQYGDMLAQARILWLRYSGDRDTLWQFIEQTLSLQILLTAAMLTGTAVIIFSVTNLPLIHLLSFTMALIAMTYSVYLALYCRMDEDKLFYWTIIAFSIGVTMAVTIIGLFSDFRDDHQHMSILYFPSVILQLIFLGLIFLLRFKAKHRFSRIDWLQVKRLKKRSRNNLSYKN